MNILICRLRPWMSHTVARNLINQGHKVHVIDHDKISEYQAERIYESCHVWPAHKYDPALREFFTHILSLHKIELVIIAQKLHFYSNAAEASCRTLGVRYVFTEYFFDDKLIFDDIGLQYTEENQVTGRSLLPIDWPKRDREPQPCEQLSRDEVKLKYEVASKDKIVIVYGQLLWDMSMKENPEGLSYDQYIDGLCTKNPDTTFLFKPHPKDNRRSILRSTRKYKHKNLVRVNESLSTLFQFEAHTAFSSTVIFEGVSRGLRFASVGYHLMRGHTYQIKKEDFSDIYNKIMKHEIDPEEVKRTVSYLTNIYALPMADPFLAQRLIEGLDQNKREQYLVAERT